MKHRIRARAGQVIGQDHRANQMNCQDSFTLIHSGELVAGIVCDGCGEGRHSEVGAKLGAQFIAGQAMSLLQEGVPVQDIPGQLYPRTINYLQRLVNMTDSADPVLFVVNYLLFTVMGVVISGDSGVVFTAGDGTLIIDESVRVIDQDNKPLYIAYHLLTDGTQTEQALPTGFNVAPLSSKWQQVAIASDGLDIDLLADVWGYEHPRGLQRQLNIWSTQHRRFRDDATVIVVEKVTEDESED